MLEDTFNQAVDEWIEHCRKPEVQYSSSIQSVRDCEPYRKIVSMGSEALPLVRQLYDRDSSSNFELSIVKGHGLSGAVREIVGEDFQIPEVIRGRVTEMEQYTKSWLDSHISEYVNI